MIYVHRHLMVGSVCQRSRIANVQCVFKHIDEFVEAWNNMPKECD